LILAGVDWSELDGAELVNVIYTTMVNDITNIETPRGEARKILDERLDEVDRQYKLQKGIKPEPEPFVMSSSMIAQMGIPIHKPPPPDKV